MFGTPSGFNILSFPYFGSYQYMANVCSRNNFCGRNCSTGLTNWLLFGKLPENPIVTPSTSVQVIFPSSVNRYLNSVTVEATTTTGA